MATRNPAVSPVEGTVVLSTIIYYRFYVSQVVVLGFLNHQQYGTGILWFFKHQWHSICMSAPPSGSTPENFNTPFSPPGIPGMDPRAAYKSQPEVAVTCDFGIQNPSTWIPETTVVKSVNVLYLGASTTLQNKVFSNQNRGHLRIPGSWWSWSYLNKNGSSKHKKQFKKSRQFGTNPYSIPPH